MRWWRKRRRARYRGIRFEEEGDTLVPRAWTAAGVAGPLTWRARMERAGEGVEWRLTIEGTLTGPDTHRGTAANAYAAGDECRAALRRAIEEHNALEDAAG